jgi:hypothetical protein
MKIIFGVLLVPILVLWGCWSFLRRSRRPKESGFRYIYVNPDGSARELTADEQEYLNTPFSGGDVQDRTSNFDMNRSPQMVG